MTCTGKDFVISAHTPGPWQYESATKTIRSKPSNYWIATIDSFEGAINHEANARLIAAAPELLEALYAIDNHARELWQQDEKYRMGIARIPRDGSGVLTYLWFAYEWLAHELASEIRCRAESDDTDSNGAAEENQP